jgi:hypothetical protein
VKRPIATPRADLRQSLISDTVKPLPEEKKPERFGGGSGNTGGSPKTGAPQSDQTGRCSGWLPSNERAQVDQGDG